MKRPNSDLATTEKEKPGETDTQQARCALATLLAAIPPRWGSPVDPFKSSSIPITSEVFGVLRYFTESFLAAAIQTQVQNVLSPTKLLTTEHIASRRIVQGCVADDRHMYSVLAMTSHQIKYLIGQKLPRMDRPEFYMAKAIEGMRRTLREDDMEALGQQAVLDITLMGTAEAYVENFKGALAHYRIGLVIAEKMGGFAKIEPFIREMCRIGDLFISSLTLLPPIFGLVGDPGEIPGGLREEIERIQPQRRMGVSFLDHDDLWDSAMLSVIHDMLDVVQAVQFLWAFPDADVSLDDRDWVLQRSHALTHKLLSMVPAAPPTTVREAIQECCRLSFVLWLFYVLAGTTGIPSEPGRLKRVRTPNTEHTRRLKKSVELADGFDADEKRWGQYDELLMWVLAFGTLANKTEGCWFAVELRREAKGRGIYTYDSLAAVIRGYLSLDRLEVLSRRKIARGLILGMIDD
jgi:hypothetical protein